MQWSDDIKCLKGVGPRRAGLLEKLGIRTLYDLLTWYPRGYEDQSSIAPISSLRAGEHATICGRIQAVSERQAIGRQKLSILTAWIEDGTGAVQATWFRQPYLKKKLAAGRRIFLTGKAAYAYGGHGQLAMSQISSFQLLEEEQAPEERTGIQPIYGTTADLSQTVFRKVVQALFALGLHIPEALPERVREERGLMERSAAFAAIHFPNSREELRAARHRLAFEELFLIQYGLLLTKQQGSEGRAGIRHLGDGSLVRRLRASLPFSLTGGQERALQEIFADMERPVPMRRLVQGDVGSGKTAVAMLALAKAVESGHQGAMMAPTEILAAQHYESFQKLLAPLGVRVDFLSGRLGKRQREELCGRIERHGTDIVVGTHALIQEGVQFPCLGLAVTDEQHRFGIAQRAELEQKGAEAPDVLVMTATPIPRTMTLTVYGDLDVSRIQELPPGRRPVRTFLRHPDRRELIYRFVHSEIQAGRQAYVVCPLIEMSGDQPIPSAEEVFEELSGGLFRDVGIGLVHGRMKAREKEAVMEAFHGNRIQLLVATTVIEVGVNVPNASVMVIEHAERFGLAQLHQLRGRIGRGSAQSYCILVSESRSGTARERLQLMETISDGFSLAEEDLRLRGPGQFFGSMQHGLPDLKIANALQDMDLLLEARREAAKALERREDMSLARTALALQYGNHFRNIRDV